ncbi:uncharacterized protein B0H18DRAFT_1081185 [Fomitopsis serialis]|uniref:uncharacterized protein n=1 Tax=Fomitopsis serialis TaxID=139415 RepID=UPI00200882EC|nr:uncharacterized protein B0H18DRAFT_1081185 [Neoantrodia serialis]KAH9938577.1 hypothetical protein B0H18DRAFT_1081185 [Neoantrodia serialis]
MEFFNDAGDDPLKPTLFELVAQEQLRDLLQPALKYSSPYPRYILRIVNRHEEFYALLMFFVERHYLRKHGASFSENFYGLKRRRRPLFETERARGSAGRTARGATPDREIWRSLIFLVGLPYLRTKAQEYYEDLGGGIQSEVIEESLATGRRTVAGRLRRMYKTVFPLLNSTFEVWLLVHNIAYLFDRTPYYRPWLAWIGVDLRRRAAQQAMKPKLDPARSQGVLRSLRRLLVSSPRLLLDSFNVILPTAIFFVKFLEWWYSPSSPARALSGSPLGPAVAPPRLARPHPQGVPVDERAYGGCPLCGKGLANATALPSGYVFCYRCAYEYVDEHGRCPVTLLPARVWELRKILFGKQIQVEQVPGWSAYYLDYKSLKKIISSLQADRPPSDAEGIAHSRVNPGAAEESFILATLGQDDERGPNFQAHKAAFFFKLERELEKINAFYLEKEAELKLRLETLLSKRRAAAMRVLPDSPDDITNNVEWSAVEEGFRLLERDLGKLQQFVEINATGFRKISRNGINAQTTLAHLRTMQLISEMSDTVAACLLDITDLSVGLNYEGSLADEKILSRELGIDRTDRNVPLGPFLDLESSLRKAVTDSDRDALRELVRYSDSLSQARGARMHVTRVLWKAVIDAPPDLADLILASTSGPFDFMFVAIVGVLRLVNICLEKGVQAGKVDVYGRSALHYAAMYGHDAVCRRLIAVGLSPDVTDVDNCTPLVYATLRGFVGCVQVLLEDGMVSVRSATPSADLIPLSLAARAGHIDVVKLLLSHGAPSVPNTNGEYPIHLAAQEGHAEIVRILASHEGWDLPDKYNEWTPLFHAARFGRDACLRVLLEEGSRIDRFDEAGNSALYYAAWYGHRPCVALLLETAAHATPGPTPITQKSPLTDTQRSTGTESDIDIIPSLYLPPPMMPYRVYGHNYLDKTSLIQVTIGHPTSRFGTEAPQGVALRRPLADSQYDERHLHSSPMLKLVMTATPAITSAPYSVPLPVRDQKIVFNFQVSAASALSLEFSLYPNFGTRTIGRAVALPYFFQGIQNGHPYVLPILDPRLHVIGEVAFEVNIITPFRGVTLEIGGAVETYWKSLATPVPTPSSRLVPSRSQPSTRSMTSVQTSPSNLSTTVASGHSLTHSSVTGSYVYVTVQVTRDFHPVAFAQWLLPEEGCDLGVADLTLEQFGALAQRSGRCLMQMDSPVLSPLQWSKLISGCMIPLAELLRVVPAAIGICLELAYPPQRVRERLSLRHQLDLNDVTDSLLRTVYDTTAAPDGAAGRRPVVFTSFSPDACAALNWKQPNYPVFLATQCGEQSRGLPSATALSVDDVRDYRFSSLDSAVEFAKSNNLLGVLLDAGLLVRVSSLMQGVKDLGLLVGTFGAQEELAQLPTSAGADANGVDAALQDGVLTYFNSYKRIQ